MTIYECSNLPAIAPISENCFITDSQYQRLKAKFKKISRFIYYIYSEKVSL